MLAIVSQAAVPVCVISGDVTDTDSVIELWVMPVLLLSAYLFPASVERCFKL